MKKVYESDEFHSMKMESAFQNPALEPQSAGIWLCSEGLRLFFLLLVLSEPSEILKVTGYNRPVITKGVLVNDY